MTGHRWPFPSFSHRHLKTRRITSVHGSSAHSPASACHRPEAASALPSSARHTHSCARVCLGPSGCCTKLHRRTEQQQPASHGPGGWTCEARRLHGQGHRCWVRASLTSSGRGCPLWSHEAQCPPRRLDPPVLWAGGCFLPGVPAAPPSPGLWAPARSGSRLLYGTSAPWLTSQLRVSSCRSGHGALQEGSTQTDGFVGPVLLVLPWRRPARSVGEAGLLCGRGAGGGPRHRPLPGEARWWPCKGTRHTPSSQCGGFPSVTAVPTMRRCCPRHVAS